MKHVVKKSVYGVPLFRVLPGRSLFVVQSRSRFGAVSVLGETSVRREGHLMRKVHVRSEAGKTWTVCSCSAAAAMRCLRDGRRKRIERRAVWREVCAQGREVD